MCNLKLHKFKKRLLQSGIAPKFVKRAVRELQHHHSELTEEAVSSGMSAAEATAYAQKQLGDLNLLVDETLARSELRSWAARWPWAIYTLIPLLTLIAATTALVLVMIGVATLLEPGKSLWPIPIELKWGADAILFLMAYIPAPLIIITLLLTALRRQASMAWPLAGAIVVAFIGCSMNPAIVWPAAQGMQGAISVSMGYGVFESSYDAGNGFNLIRLGAMLVVIASLMHYRQPIRERYLV